MAVTKTHPIKSTLKAAIDYICNPEKTDGKLLVSSYGCAAEMILAKEKAGSPFQDFLLGSATVRVAVIQFSMAVLRNRSPFLRVEV